MDGLVVWPFGLVVARSTDPLMLRMLSDLFLGEFDRFAIGLFGRLVCWSYVVLLSFGPLDVGPEDVWTLCPLDGWSLGHVVLWTFLDIRSFVRLDIWSFGPLDVWSSVLVIGRLDACSWSLEQLGPCWSFGPWSAYSSNVVWFPCKLCFL